MNEKRPAYTYASELLDDSTCWACTEIDGTEWDTLEEARKHYPEGQGYAHCEGTCRGTLVLVWEDDADDG